MITKLAFVSQWAENVPVCAHFYRDVIGLRLYHFGCGGGRAMV